MSAVDNSGDNDSIQNHKIPLSDLEDNFIYCKYCTEIRVILLFLKVKNLVVFMQLIYRPTLKNNFRCPLHNQIFNHSKVISELRTDIVGSINNS